jgi:hypothetical protein
VAVLAFGAPACTMHQYQQVTVIVPPQEPLRGDATGTLSLGESPGDLSAAQINAALDGYGVWVDSPSYGRIWRPDEATVGPTFMPYGSAGQWLATNAGWYWQSDYAWGRVAFHYGRWVLDGAAWCWVPGSQFAPAWVDWRAGGGWVGWSALAPIGARSRAPFVYCAHGGLSGPGLGGRLIHGAAGSSLYARTTAVSTDGDTPRGPAGPTSTLALTQVWSAPPRSDPQPLRSASALASVVGVDTVERIPVARVRELPPVSDPPVEGVAVVIRDRDLIGMSEGPSVRRPAGAAPILPDPVIAPRPATVVMTLPSSPRVASAAPPPLPPPPDGVAFGVYPGAYPMRPSMAFASRRAPMNAPSFAGPTVLVAPSPQPVAQPVARPSSTGAGGWIGPTAGSRSTAPGPGAPISSVQ